MVNKQLEKSMVFKDFTEYWYFARYLSTEQRDTIYKSLSQKQQKLLSNSFKDGDWEDVFSRNVINELVVEFENQYKINLLAVKCKVIQGKSVYMPKQTWNDALELLSQFKPKHIIFILGGIKAVECSQNKDVVLIIPTSSQLQD
jgi:hypothetical protein